MVEYHPFHIVWPNNNQSILFFITGKEESKYINWKKMGWLQSAGWTIHSNKKVSAVKITWPKMFLSQNQQGNSGSYWPCANTELTCCGFPRLSVTGRDRFCYQTWACSHLLVIKQSAVFTTGAKQGVRAANAQKTQTQFSDWLMVRKQGGVTGINIINPQTKNWSGGYMLTGIIPLRFFQLVGV